MLLRVQSQQLPTESQVLKDEVLAGAESADHPPKEMPERHVHARILSETSNRALRQVIYFVSVRRFDEAQESKRKFDNINSHFCYRPQLLDRLAPNGAPWGLRHGTE